MRGWGLRGALIGLLLAVPVFLVGRMGAVPRPTPYIISDHSWQEGLEDSVRRVFPFEGVFEQIRLNLLLLSGQKEQNGIFISEKGLIKRIGPFDPAILEDNIAAIEAFADRTRDWEYPVPVFVSLLPTSAAILQQNLPLFSNTINQRQVIESTYNRLIGRASTINVYPRLLSHREEYIYYRTEHNFTALGGFYLYSELLPRLINAPAPSLSLYHASYPRHEYYGDLYRASPYQGTPPDALTLFHYARFSREYTVTHTSLGQRKVYHSLFPEHRLALGDDMGVYLGGLSAITQIDSSAPYDRSLLIFGDRTAISYVPFLANHYKRITVVDLAHPDATLSGIHAGQYSQILFAYSTETILGDRLPQDLLERVIAE